MAHKDYVKNDCNFLFLEKSNICYYWSSNKIDMCSNHILNIPFKPIHK